MKHHPAYLPGIEVTKALIKFCEEHNRQYPPLAECLKALGEGDSGALKKAFREIPIGGMMTFTDWIPSAAFENETDEYVSTVFAALTERWFRLMTELVA